MFIMLGRALNPSQRGGGRETRQTEGEAKEGGTEEEKGKTHIHWMCVHSADVIPVSGASGTSFFFFLAARADSNIQKLSAGAEERIQIIEVLNQGI